MNKEQFNSKIADIVEEFSNMLLSTEVEEDVAADVRGFMELVELSPIELHQSKVGGFIDSAMDLSSIYDSGSLRFVPGVDLLIDELLSGEYDAHKASYLLFFLRAMRIAVYGDAE